MSSLKEMVVDWILVSYVDDENLTRMFSTCSNKCASQLGLIIRARCEECFCSAPPSATERLEQDHYYLPQIPDIWQNTRCIFTHHPEEKYTSATVHEFKAPYPTSD